MYGEESVCGKKIVKFDFIARLGNQQTMVREADDIRASDVNHLFLNKLNLLHE